MAYIVVSAVVGGVQKDWPALAVALQIGQLHAVHVAKAVEHACFFVIIKEQKVLPVLLDVNHDAPAVVLVVHPAVVELLTYKAAPVARTRVIQQFINTAIRH